MFLKETKSELLNESCSNSAPPPAPLLQPNLKRFIWFYFYLFIYFLSPSESSARLSCQVYGRTSSSSASQAVPALPSPVDAAAHRASPVKICPEIKLTSSDRKQCATCWEHGQHFPGLLSENPPRLEPSCHVVDMDLPASVWGLIQIMSHLWRRTEHRSGGHEVDKCLSAAMWTDTAVHTSGRHRTF